MSYSIKPILHHAADKNGLHKIQILIIYKRMKFTLATNYKVLQDQFTNGRCKGFKHANDINGNLIALKDKFEKLLLSVIESDPSKEMLQQLFKEQPAPVAVDLTFAEYTKELVKRFKGKLGAARLIHYNTLATQIKAFNDLRLNDVSPKTALQVEQHLRSLGFAQNTLNTKMKIFKAIINQAILEKLIEPDCLLGYKKPNYVQPIPDYLTQDEMKQFKRVVEASGPTRYKVAGYYFLLSCLAGYRISDLKKFDYDKAVKNNLLTIRATKNANICTIPIYPALAEILQKVKQYPFYFTIESMRKYVKELALLAGLNRKIKVHTARHTFAITLMQKGFTIDEVAELLGDSKDVAKIYARVTNTQLHNKVKEKLY